MRHLTPPTPTIRPHVAIIVDGARTYGRDVLRGVTQFANLKRQWILFKDLNDLLETDEPWPAFDGAIFAGVSHEKFQHGLENIPHVVFCSGAADPELSPVVCSDDVAIGAQAAQHLIDCQLKNFGFYGWNDRFKVAVNRLKGFQEALKKQGFPCAVCPVGQPTDLQWTAHDHRPGLIKWLSEQPKPIGIMAIDDHVAHDLSEACLEQQIGVPDEVAIIGVNNDELLCDSAWPPLTSIETDHTRMGFEAAKLLDRLFNGETLEKYERYVQLPPLGPIKRQSTDVLAIGDRSMVDAIRFIQEHACDPCSVLDVLKVVPVARRWLERQFMTQLGRTPYDEIIRVRMETAKRYLAHPDMTVAEIVKRCGYSSDTNFHRAFRQIAGATPAAFRRSILRGTRD